MDLVTGLYSISGLIVGAAFVPQAAALLRDKSGAVTVNFPAWLLFTFASLVTLLYAVTHNGDAHFIFYSTISVVGNLTVVALAALRRFQGL